MLFIQAVRLPMALMAAFSVLLSFLLLQRLLNGPLAFLAASLLAFDPIFLANSRVIHVDAPLSYFMLTSFLAFLLYLKEGRWRWLIVSGLLGGLAVLSKTPAALLGPILTVGGLLFLLSSTEQVERRVRLKRLGLALLGWGVIAAVAFVALWPSMWARPTVALARIVGDVWQALNMVHPSSGLFWGKLVTDQSPWYYLVAFPFHLTPLTSIGLLGGLAMIIAGIRDRRRGEESFAVQVLPLAVAIVVYIILFVIPVSIVSRRMARYLLPIFLAADVLAALGLWWLAGLVTRVWGRQLLVPIAALQIILVMTFHPYYFD
jgi:4-amino-4-deoxy-L-arabinose transferase-like glycosyltransferase